MISFRQADLMESLNKTTYVGKYLRYVYDHVKNPHAIIITGFGPDTEEKEFPMKDANVIFYNGENIKGKLNAKHVDIWVRDNYVFVNEKGKDYTGMWANVSGNDTGIGKIKSIVDGIIITEKSYHIKPEEYYVKSIGGSTIFFERCP